MGEVFESIKRGLEEGIEATKLRNLVEDLAEEGKQALLSAQNKGVSLDEACAASAEVMIAALLKVAATNEKPATNPTFCIRCYSELVGDPKDCPTHGYVAALSHIEAISQLRSLYESSEQKLKDVQRERNALAQAIGTVVTGAGIAQNVPMTGPELLLMLNGILPTLQAAHDEETRLLGALEPLRDLTGNYLGQSGAECVRVIQSVLDTVDAAERGLTLAPGSETAKSELSRVQAEAAALREGLEKLGSMQAFATPRAIDPVRDEELVARIDYAREVLKTALSIPITSDTL